jgi:signal recognition particle subunit SRP54
MFDRLSERLQSILRELGGQARIHEGVLDPMLRQVRLALLEADVHVGVVQALLAAVREKALGEEVRRSLTPGQQVVKIVRDELARVLGADTPGGIRRAPRPPTVVLLVGLQGSGKTTTTAKLAVWLKANGHHPFLVPADVQRPAAVEQLVRLARQSGLQVLDHDGTRTPLELALAGLARAREAGFDTLLVDTAGRLHVDEQLMGELQELEERLAPTEILLVADAMTGQDAVRSATDFHRALSLTGIVLSKLDGDARGGAALSIRHVTGVPIKFAGVGERPGDLEPFQPERMAGRILGMGDLLGLIERAEEALDVSEAQALERQIRKNQFTLEEFRTQLGMLRRMGPLQGIVSMLPGMSQVREADLDPRAIVRVVAIIDSMTPRERRNPQILDARRKRRVARGSGQAVQEINRLLKQFAQIKRMMKTMEGLARSGRGKGRFPGLRGRLPFGGR